MPDQHPADLFEPCGLGQVRRHGGQPGGLVPLALGDLPGALLTLERPRRHRGHDEEHDEERPVVRGDGAERTHRRDEQPVQGQDGQHRGGDAGPEPAGEGRGEHGQEENGGGSSQAAVGQHPRHAGGRGHRGDGHHRRAEHPPGPVGWSEGERLPSWRLRHATRERSCG